MNQENMKQPGLFSWNELLTTDIDAARKFYGKLFGWTMEDVKTCDMGYSMVKAGDREVAGMMMMPDNAVNMSPAWGAYVTVDDVDSSTAHAESLHAKVCVTPQDIPGVGRFSVITDPQGAMLAMISYSDGG
ncbi:MAG TPA: VOC family protein [Gammaproteobacteria bacterium]|nr:VOC family protein [Gammaproteobacteria bacterium]